MFVFFLGNDDEVVEQGSLLFSSPAPKHPKWTLSRASRSLQEKWKEKRKEN